MLENNLNNVSELVDNFTNYASVIKDQANEILLCISDGRAPDKKDLDSFNLNISKLQVKYDAISTAAEEYLSSDEFPGKGESIFAYSEAIKNSKKKEIEEKINSAKSILKKFVSVKATVQKYTDALKPFQEEALLLLNNIEKNNIDSFDDLNDFDGAKCFIEAITVDDLDNDGGDELIDTVGKYYNSTVATGVARGRYSIQADDIIDNDDKSQDGKETGVIDTKEESDIQISSKEVETIKEKESDENSKNDVTSEEDEEVTWESLGIINSDAIISNVDDALLSITECKKSKEFSASKFINELKKSPYRSLLLLIFKVTHNTLGNNVEYLTDYISRVFSEDTITKEDVTVCCEKMVQLGYFKKYSIDSYGDYYSLTKLGMKILSTKKTSDFLKETPINVSICEPSNNSNSVCSSVLRTRFWQLLFNPIESASSYSTTTDEDCFLFTSRDADSKHKTLITAGIISKAPFQFKLIKDEVSKRFNDNAVLVFGSEKTESSKAILQWILSDICEESLRERVFYTDINCKDIYHFLDDNKIEVSELENILKDDSSVEDNGSSGNDEPEITPDKGSNEEIIPKDNNCSSNIISSPTTISTNENDEISQREINNDEEKDISEKQNSDDVSDEEIEEYINAPERISDNDFIHLIDKIIAGKIKSKNTNSDVVRATILAKCASLYASNIESKKLYSYLLAATRLPLDSFSYSSTVLADVMESENESLILAAYMQAMLIPATEYEFGLRQQTSAYLKDFETYFPNYIKLKPLFNKLKDIENVVPYGYTSSVLALLSGKAETKKYLNELSKKASELKQIPQIKTGIRLLPKLYYTCFGEGSELFYCLDTVEKSNIDEWELVVTVLKEYCDSVSEGLIISKDKINSKIDEQWELISEKDFKLTYTPRQQLVRYFINRLELIKTWTDHISESKESKLDVKRVNVLKNEILKITSNLLEDNNDYGIEYSSVIKWTLNYIVDYLSGKHENANPFMEYAITGIFSLDDNGVPIIDESLADITFYSPWKNLLRHIISDIQTLEEAKENIYLQSDIFDNLNQLKWIGYFNSEDICIDESQIIEAQGNADYRLVKFKEDLELAYTYSRIVESDKERLQAIMENCKDFFYSIHDYGCWSQFLNSLEKEIDYLTAENKIKLRNDLDARKSKLGFCETSSILDEAEMLLEESQNFAVTEEYLNRFDSGERNFSDELSAILNEKDNFAEFLSDELFKPIFNDCEKNTGRSLKNFGLSYISSRYPEGWTTRQKENSKELIENWPARLNTTTPTNISKLLTRLGFVVEKVENVSSSGFDSFKAYVNATPKSMSDYRHPISKFGTKMINPINVIVYYGKLAPQELVNKVSDLDYGEMSLVLVDRPIDRASRRQISEIFHTQTSGQNPFIFIDQVLLLYLAGFQETERLSIMLKCTLPYTTYQPFVHDGGSTTDEMFFGRSKELATILDPNGACIVYGGRQLGKTALLQRAEGRFNNPSERKYAIYCDIRPCHSEKEMVLKIVEEINIKTDFNISDGIDTIDGLRKNLLKKFNNKTINKMLLLIDEADNFLDGISKNNYDPLQGLINLKRETTNDFKFVLAGLHNVCRAKNATSDNGVFGQLGTPLCIKPLSPTEALQLLSRPLRYLGFEIDRYPHLETILTNTNYYPGILQFFGYKLVEAFTTDYGKYYHAADGQPPFELKDEQLGTVMNSKDLNNSIKEKFKLSLELDQRYFMLARCITMLYHYRNGTDSSWLGYSVDKIKEMAETYNILCLNNSSVTDYSNLLDEMVEMGILSKPYDGLYRLRRNSFVDIIGSNMDDLDREIEDNNMEV